MGNDLSKGEVKPPVKKGPPVRPPMPQEDMNKKYGAWVSRHLPKWCKLTRRMELCIPRGGTFELTRWENLYKNFKHKLIEPNEKAAWSRWTVESYQRQNKAQGIFITKTGTGKADQEKGGSQSDPDEEEAEQIEQLATSLVERAVGNQIDLGARPKFPTDLPRAGLTEALKLPPPVYTEPQIGATAPPFALAPPTAPWQNIFAPSGGKVFCGVEGELLITPKITSEEVSRLGEEISPCQASAYPVREQFVVGANGQNDRQVSQHVPWTPGEMRGFLSSLPKPRSNPHGFVGELYNIAVSYNPTWRDLLQIIRAVAGQLDTAAMCTKLNLPLNPTPQDNTSTAAMAFVNRLQTRIAEVFPPQSWVRVTNIQQKAKEPVEDYFERFRQAVEEAGGSLEDQGMGKMLTATLVSGLNKEIHDKLVSAHSDWREKTVPALMSLASSIQRSIDEVQEKRSQRILVVDAIERPQWKQFRGTNGGGARRIKCYNCDKLGHIARNCTAPKRGRGESN